MTDNEDKCCTLWSSEIDLSDWTDFIEDLKNEYPDISDVDIYSKVVDMNYVYLNDLRDQFNLTVDGTIIAVIDVSRWNGRRADYNIIGNKISDCFKSDTDCNVWYIEEDNLKCKSMHHYDTIYTTYYFIPNTIKWDEDELYDAVFSKVELQNFINNHMKPIGNIIKEFMLS